MDQAMFGLTGAQIAEFGLTFGVGGFILFMLFIIWDLARKSKAGRLGTFVLFFVLAFGMFGFVAKSIIAKLLGIWGPAAGPGARPRARRPAARRERTRLAEAGKLGAVA